MLTLYEKIEHLCKGFNTNVSGMCRDTGISRSTLSELKAGRSETLSTKTLTKIADYFGTTVDILISDDLYQTEPDRKKLHQVFGQKNKPLVNNDEELTEYLQELKTRPEMKMLFNLAKGATKEDVEKAVKIVEAFLKKD